MLELCHKKLIAWQKAIALMPLIYNACAKLPKEEPYNLIGQMKRAGLSVSNHLAKGAALKSKAEKTVFMKSPVLLWWK
jgi:four helix bundle protein